MAEPLGSLASIWGSWGFDEAGLAAAPCFGRAALRCLQKAKEKRRWMMMVVVHEGQELLRCTKCRARRSKRSAGGGGKEVKMR